MPEKLDRFDIRDLRIRAKMTQIQLAAYLGVEKGTVNRWETNKQRPSQLALRQLHRLHEKVISNDGNKPQPNTTTDSL